MPVDRIWADITYPFSPELVQPPGFGNLAAAEGIPDNLRARGMQPSSAACAGRDHNFLTPPTDGSTQPEEPFVRTEDNPVHG